MSTSTRLVPILKVAVSHPLMRLVTVVLVVWGAIALFGLLTGGRTAYSDTDKTFNAAYWKQQLTQKDPAAVYSSFQKKNAAAPQTRQHFSAHVMGGLLADALGTKGITVCDASFGFGCFHGFFARLISSGGTALISSLDQECVAKYGPFGTGCQHGIGHGVLEYVGYTNLSKALELCKETTQKVPLLGCVTGVFMEYNTPLAGAENGLIPDRRKFDPDHPYEPCTSVAPEYQGSCYLELGHWLVSSVGTDISNLERVCGGLSGDARKYCFLGIGDVTAPMHSYSLSESTAFCDQFTETGALYCRAGVSWALFANPEYRPNAKAACTFTDAEKSAECQTFADLTEGQANQ